MTIHAGQRYSQKDIRLADTAEEAVLAGHRWALDDPTHMPLAVVQRIGHLFLRPTPPIGPWPAATIVALLEEFRDRGLAEPTDRTDNLPQILQRVLAVHVDHARRSREALRQLRERQRAELAAALCAGRQEPAWRGFETAVIDLARLYGWRVHHQRPAQRSDGSWRSAIQGHPGFPDLVMARGPRHGRPARIIVSELKSGRGRVRPGQREWTEILGQVAGVEVHLWHERNLEDIAEVLA